MKKSFKLVGLSKPRSATLLTEDEKNTFNSPIKMEQDRFDALFQYFKSGSWEGTERATIEFRTLSDGIPIEPLIIDVTL